MKHRFRIPLVAALMLHAVARSETPDVPAVRGIALPGGGADGVSMDYLAYDRTHDRVWVPAGNTGSVDVVDATKHEVKQLSGFRTSEIERNGKKRTVGPSSAAVGDGVVYVGNRGDSSICAIEAGALEKRGCVTLDSMPDALAYVSSRKELWATTPRDRSITIFDAAMAAAPKTAARMRLDGAPEGVAVDDARGLFYTNLEDADRTLAIDVAKRRVSRTWPSGCGEHGPKGLALDGVHGFLFVACSSRVKVLDVVRDGRELSAIDTGEGVDDIAYVERRGELYVAAAHAAKLTIARIDDAGRLSVEVVVPTAAGARNPVVSADGSAFLTDSPEGKLLVVPPLPPR